MEFFLDSLMCELHLNTGRGGIAISGFKNLPVVKACWHEFDRADKLCTLIYAEYGALESMVMGEFDECVDDI